MFNTGKVAARTLQAFEIYISTHDTRPACQAVQYCTPGIDYHAVPIGFTTVEMIPSLVRRDDIAQVLDGAGPHQYFPVRTPGNGGKGGWQYDNFHTGIELLPEQLWKAQIVTNTQAKATERGIDDNYFIAWLDGIGLGILFTTIDKIHIEQMHLVIARDLLALVIENQTGGSNLVAIFSNQRNRATHQPDTMAGGLLREKSLDRSGTLVLPYRDFILFSRSHQGKVFGQDDQPRILADCLGNQAFRFQQVPTDIRT